MEMKEKEEREKGENRGGWRERSDDKLVGKGVDEKP